jgi:hypothetical protein
MSTSNLVGLIVDAERQFQTGSVKRQWVLHKLNDSGLSQVDAGILIDDIVALVSSQAARKLFADSGTICTNWFCRGK